MKPKSTEDLSWMADARARRDFVKSLVAAGTGTLVITSGAYGESRFTETGCNPSPADSLIFFMGLLTDVQQQAVDQFAQKVIGELSNCEQVLKKVYDQCLVLEKELERSALKSEARHMRELLEVQRAHARLLRDYVGATSDLQYAGMHSLAFVSERILKSAKDLRPSDGGMILSTEGVAALKEIIRLVKEYKDSNKKAGMAQEDHQAELTRIHAQIKSIKDWLMNASNLIVQAETSQAQNAATLRRQARGEITKAITELGKLPPDASPSSDKDQPKEKLALLLSGVGKWIEQQQTGKMARMDSYGPSSTIRLASFPGSSKSPQVNVRSLLGEHCPPASILRALHCLSIVTPVWLLPISVEDRVNLIEDALNLSRFQCLENRSIRDFASALASV